MPFASPDALYGLSSSSVWWLRLGIGIERIKPANPQQSGRHERMHLTLKKATTNPPSMNMLQQQDQFRLKIWAILRQYRLLFFDASRGASDGKRPFNPVTS